MHAVKIEKVPLKVLLWIMEAELKWCIKGTLIRAFPVIAPKSDPRNIKWGCLYFIGVSKFASTLAIILNSNLQ